MVTERIVGLPWWLSSKRIHLPIQETWVQPQGQEDPGEGNGNPLQYSSCEIPQTEEPGERSCGRKRVKHKLVTKQQQQK